MKNFQLLFSAAIAISSVAGAGIAVLHNFPAKTQASASLLNSLSATATSAENPPAVFTNVSDQTISVTKPAAIKLKTAALVSAKLDNFPHQRFTLNVSVRSQPQKNSAVVALLSNEVVEVDHQIKAQQVTQTTFGESNNSTNNWTPVILPQGRQGYVYNRFVYSPSEYQAVFGKIQGQWRLLAMPGGY